MRASFESDAYPGRPKILFLGFAESTHTHAWIDLLEGAQFNVRLFALPSGGVPPDNWHTRTYVTSYDCPPLNPATRARLYSKSRILRFAKRNAARLRGAGGGSEV